MQCNRGLSCPVIVPESIDWQADYSSTTLDDLLAMPDEHLAAVDPLAMNLIVAKAIPALSHLNIAHYQSLINTWVSDFTNRCLPLWEPYFYEAPEKWHNDIRYFRLGTVCQYLDLEVGVEYNADQRDVQKILYTTPSDMFLNGVLDTNQGTCGNLASLHLAFGWRLGWPVSLCCVNSHYLLRFDDGESVYNIEATQTGNGGFRSDPDDYVIREQRLPPVAITSGSDLRALRPREVLGVFVGLRARYFQDVGKHDDNEAKILAAEPDWLLARQLYPVSRLLYKNQMVTSALRGDAIFDPHEAGHPETYSECLREIRYRREIGWGLSPRDSSQRQTTATPEAIDDMFFSLGVEP